MNNNIGFYFKTDNKIGGGHFWRCLNFAKTIYNKKNNIYFITNYLNINYLNILNKERIKLIQLKEINNYNLLKKVILTRNIKTLISDYYKFTLNNKKKIRKLIKKLIVIDDFTNKKHFCDIFINNNFLDPKFKSEIKKLNPKTKHFLGPEYFFCNKKLKYKIKKDYKVIKKIFIFFGSSDNSNTTLKMVKYLQKFNKFNYDIVIGNMNKNSFKLRKFCNKFRNFKIYSSVSNDKILQIMRKNDLSIGSGGVNLYERLFIRLPSIVITNADNQINSSKSLSKKKIISYFGTDKDLSQKKFLKFFFKFLNNNEFKLLETKMKQFFSFKKREKGFWLNIINK